MVRTINLAAAASLVNGLEDAITAFKNSDSEYDDVDFICKYDGSYTLANAIANGTDLTSDLFLAAAQDAMLNSRIPGIEVKIVIATKDDFIGNSLVLIKNKKGVANLTNITSFETLTLANLGSGHAWIANPDNAPAGKYAKDAIELTTSTGNWGALLVKASNEGTLGSNVQTTLAGLLANTNPAVGLVYNSDYKNSPSIPDTNAFFVAYAPQSVNDNIIYPAAVLTNAASHGVDTIAAAFVTFLKNYADTYFTVAMGYTSLN